MCCNYAKKKVPSVQDNLGSILIFFFKWTNLKLEFFGFWQLERLLGQDNMKFVRDSEEDLRDKEIRIEQWSRWEMMALDLGKGLWIWRRGNKLEIQEIDWWFFMTKWPWRLRAASMMTPRFLSWVTYLQLFIYFLR